MLMQVGRRLRSVSLVALLGIALLACKKKSTSSPSPSVSTESEQSKRFKELAPKVKTLVGKLPTMAEKAKSEPVVKKDQPLADKLDKAKFLIVGDKWLDAPDRKADEGEVDLGSSTLYLCKNAAGKDPHKTKNSDLKNDVGYMEECLGWEYVAVLRARAVTMPKIKMASKSFDKGEVQGDLLLFSASTAEVAARYTFRTTNSDELSWFEDTPEQEWVDKSKRDLVENLQGVIQERLAGERDTMGK